MFDVCELTIIRVRILGFQFVFRIMVSTDAKKFFTYSSTNLQKDVTEFKGHMDASVGMENFCESAAFIEG